MGNLKQSIVRGVLWQGLERIGSYGINFIVSIILARLLSPEEFGVIAIMMVFIALSNVFIDSGFSTALIQKKDMIEADCCSVFYINIVMSFVLYGILYLASPFIAGFYETEGLTLYLHVFSLILIIRSFSLVQNALLRKRMLFHLSFRISWVALIISGTVGIVMAYSGCGVWSLIAQQLSNAFVTVILQWLLVKWRPHWLFDWNRTKELFNFGWKMFCSGFLDTLYMDIYSIVIGKIADLKMLSFYDRGKHYPQLGMNIINSTIGIVLLPAFSELQDDRKKTKELARRGLKNIMFIVTPTLAFLFVFADSITIVLLTEKWLPSVIFMRLCCITFFFWPFATMNLQIITAYGRSDVFLILEIIKKAQGILVIAATYRFGVVTMVATGAAMGLVGVFENGWYNRKLIDYAPWQQLWDIVPIAGITVLVSAISYFITIPIHNIWLKLITGTIAFGALYLVSTIVTHTFPRDMSQIIQDKVLKRIRT
jgi:O-antigen/teichoic acid export membrane protein